MQTNPMLDFVKALSHADRLKIIGALTERPASTKELAEALQLPFREVFQHVSMLEYFGIIHAQGENWVLDTENLEKLARLQLQEQPGATSAPAPTTDPARKVLAAYLNPDGSLRQIPSQPAKLQIILNYLLEAFTPGVIYTEKAVNQIIRRFHLDTAGLRRDLIDRNMLQRKSDGSQYWRPEKPLVSEE